MRATKVGGALVGAVAVAVLVIFSSRSTAARDRDPVERGEELYLLQCVSCHGVGGAGTPRGPSLRGVGAASADFYLSSGRMPAPEGRGYQATRKQPAFNRRDIDAILELLSPDIEYRMPMDPLGQYPVFRGHEGVREFHQTVWNAFEEFRAELRSVTQMGDVWTAVGQMVARPPGAAEPVRFNFSHFWRVNEDYATAVAFHDAVNPFGLLERVEREGEADGEREAS